MPNYTTPPTAVSGFGLSAADWNSKIRDSLEDVAKPKRCRVNRTANQSIGSASVSDLIWQNEEYDTDNIWTPGGTANLFTIPSGGAGVWRAIFCAQFAINATGARHLGIQHNGIIKAAFNNAGNASWYVGGCVELECLMAVGDTVKAYGYQTSGVALNVDITYPVTFSIVQVAR